MISKETKKHLMTYFVQSKLPEFVKAVHEANGNDTVVVLHQDAFCADYQEDEFYLLGCAIKYAGEYGVEVRVIGKNQDTLTQH